MGNHQLGTGGFVHNRIVSAVKGIDFITDRMSYIALRGHWCNIIGLNAHAQTEEKSDDSKEEESKQVFDPFSKYHIKILLGYFNAKFGRKGIFKRQSK